MPIVDASELLVEQHLRLALGGPPGSGKTYSALRIGAEIARRRKTRLVVIDSEHGKSALYARQFRFAVDRLKLFAPQAYIEALREVYRAGYGVVIIDSLSHAWMGPGGILEMVGNKGGNGFANWKDGDKQTVRLIDALLAAPMDIIVCLRAKVEHQQDPTTMKVTRVGMQMQFRNGVEYEFDVVMMGSPENNAFEVIKTRNPALFGRSYIQPGEDLAEELWDWLTAPPPEPDPHYAAPVTAPTPVASRPGEPLAGAPTATMNGDLELDEAFDGPDDLDDTPAAQELPPEPDYPGEHAPPQRPTPRGPIPPSTATPTATNGHGGGAMDRKAFLAAARQMGLDPAQVMERLGVRSLDGLNLDESLDQLRRRGANGAGAAPEAATRAAPARADRPVVSPPDDADPIERILSSIDPPTAELPEGEEEATEQQYASIGKLTRAMGLAEAADMGRDGRLRYSHAKAKAVITLLNQAYALHRKRQPVAAAAGEG